MEKSFTIAALYKFLPIADLEAEQAFFKNFALYHKLCGTLLIAHEGVNGTLAGTQEAIDALVAFVDQRYGIPSTEVKISHSAYKPFKRLKVRLKQEIVSMREPSSDPNKHVGVYLDPAEWDKLTTEDDNVLLLDTRNKYETEYGLFKGAIDPNIQNFTDFVDYVRTELKDQKDKKIAMYCTGGIRCEKASAFMLSEGFNEVYHLKGGILRYLEETPAEKSTWEGRCFVFDDRISVGHDLNPEPMPVRAVDTSRSVKKEELA